jgi:hypothetical protein
MRHAGETAVAAITQGEIIRTILQPLQCAADTPPIAPAYPRQATCHGVASSVLLSSLPSRLVPRATYEQRRGVSGANDPSGCLPSRWQSLFPAAIPRDMPSGGTPRPRPLVPVQPRGIVQRSTVPPDSLRNGVRENPTPPNVGFSGADSIDHRVSNRLISSSESWSG